MNIKQTLESVNLNMTNGRLDLAQSLIQEVLIHKPKNAAANHMMGVLQSILKNHRQSLSYMKQAVKLDPTLQEAKFNLGKAYRNLEQYNNAVREFSEITTSDPTNIKAWLELAIAQEKLGCLDSAIKSLEKVLGTKAETYNIVCKVGSLYMIKSAYHSAVKCFLKAIKINALAELAWINLAISYENLSMPNKSINIYQKLCKANPKSSEAQLRLALTLLSNGNMEEGWRHYQKRASWNETNTSHGQLDVKFWSGENLSNKSILIWTEQGPGDEILTGSMIPEVISSKAAISIACSPNMFPLFQRSFPQCTIIQRKGNKLPLDIIDTPDYQASMTELGQETRNSFKNIFPSKPYLKLNKSRVELLKKRYNTRKNDIPVIGISWKSANKKSSKNKSTELSQWYPIFSKIKAYFVCLQYGDTEKERADVKKHCNTEIIYNSDINQLENMDLFAHQVAAMDLVISTSNTTVHVAGAVGTTTWAIIPEGSGKPWYWFLDQKDCLWYPSVSFYRQKESGNWLHPLTEVRNNLSQWTEYWTSQKR